jgi:HSP20 family protein
MAGSESTRNPFEGVTDFFSELGRMRELGTRGHEHPHEDKERTHASAWVPATDIFARGDDLVIRVELAGVDPSDINLHFNHGVLVVSGTRRSELDDDDGVEFYIRERFYGEFRRTITLPEGTQQSQISAEFDDGLVEITVSGGITHSDATRIALSDKSAPPTTRSMD